MIEVAGRSVTSFAHVENAVVAHVKNEPPDTPATVRVVRDGKYLELRTRSIGSSSCGAEDRR